LVPECAARLARQFVHMQSARNRAWSQPSVVQIIACRNTVEFPMQSNIAGVSMKTAALALVSSLWCVCPPAQAGAWFHGGFTAEEMLVHCSAEEKDPVKDFGRGICIGFIDGFAAGHYVGETYHAFHHREEKIEDIYGHLCIPDTVKRGQLAKIFVQFLETNREKRKLPAGLVLEDALREAFPCPK
jgi:hypothetical protein